MEVSICFSGKRISRVTRYIAVGPKKRLEMSTLGVHVIVRVWGPA